MKNKKITWVLGIVLAFALINFTFAADANYCCEKTTSGAWCQNAPQAQCNSAFKTSPTACDSTSYCKRGCCFDSKEGLCMENTAQKVCSDSGGTWANDSSCNIPQCNLGCCVLADQGAFVTLARCRALSGFYGLKTDFRTNIGDELTCIATAQGEDKGACVFQDTATFQNTCKFTSRSNCPTAGMNLENANLSRTNSTNNKSQAASPGFYKDILCTAEELGTNCAKSTETMLISGKDEVYYKDTCGQPANIYDASRYNDNQYWKKVYKKSESCGAGSSNAKSTTCGNCDYYLGSIGKAATRSTGFATYGDNICIDLGCKSVGKKHGESWCVKDSPSGDGQDPVGARYFKEVCLNGEVLTEPCADYRNEICIEGTFNGYSEAACRVNRWQDCSKQLEASDCENVDQRDCKWTAGYYFSSNTGQIEKSNNDSKKGDLTPSGLCTPNYPPGSAFWGSTTTGRTSSSAGFPAGNGSVRPTSAYGTGYVDPTSTGSSTTAQCSAGNAKITFKWTKSTRPADFLNLFGKEGSWSCDQTTGNCQYLSDADNKNANISQEAVNQWATDMNNICYQLGDCGGYINWQQKYTDDGYAAYKDQKRVAGSGGAEILEATKKTTGTASGSSSSSSTSPSLGQGASALGSAASALGGLGGSSSSSSGVTTVGKVITGNVVKDMIKEIFIGK